ncbi:MAG: site-2 protease family protein [Planctomycetales bacterium]|nr:site-2 protease family protein [bacterium]UNM08425.1 MAG: site-2 protease family protein [Planctomycetales bacterium]
MSNFDPLYFLTAIPLILLSLALHEYGHAAMANALGDPTPRLQGRVTLNPIKHLDPAGTFMIIMTSFMGFGFGWGKPVQTNPTYYKDLRRDTILVAIAGPAMNLCQLMLAVGIANVLYITGAQLGSWGHLAFQIFIVINIALMFFNLVPLPPLDGGHVATMLLPHPYGRRLQELGMNGVTFLVLMGLMFTGLLGLYLHWVVNTVFRLIAAGFGDDFLIWLLRG